MNQNTLLKNSCDASEIASKRCLSGSDVQVGELVAGEHVGVPDDLVNDVGLGCVEGNRVVADVLGRVEDPVCERAVELPGRNQARHRPQPESGERVQALVDLGELRHPSCGKDEPVSRLEISRAGVTAVLGCELGRDDAPDLVLLWRCSGRRGSGHRARRRRRPRRSRRASAVVLVAEPGMVLGKVQVLGMGREDSHVTILCSWRR